MSYKFFFLILLMAPVARAGEVAALAPEEVDASTQPALTIDNWKPKSTPVPAPAPEPAVPSVPVVAPPAASAAPASTAPSPVSSEPSGSGLSVAARAAMNSMTGTLSSIDLDEQTLRLSVDGGINPEIAFDDKTVVESDGRALKMADLQTGDTLVVRYMGTDLTARDIERLDSRAGRR